jgi:hypothetical protein
MGKEHTLTLMAPNTKAFGKKINKMDSVLNLGQMEPLTRESTNKGKSAAKENLNGQTDPFMMVSLQIIILTVLEYTPGEIKDNMLGTGKIIKWTGKDFSHGLTKENMRVTTKMIKRTVMEHLNGIFY